MLWNSKNDGKLFTNWVNKVYHNTYIALNMLSYVCMHAIAERKHNIFAAKSFNFCAGFLVTRLTVIDLVAATCSYERAAKYKWKTNISCSWWCSSILKRTREIWKKKHLGNVGKSLIRYTRMNRCEILTHFGMYESVWDVFPPLVNLSKSCVLQK